MRIGQLNFKQPMLQAALSGYTDRAMRILARRFGCELTFSGVMLDKSACHKSVMRMKNYQIKDDDHPIGGQLLGTDPKIMAQAALNFVAQGYDIIDLNFACPAPKVLRRRRGGAMLGNPKLVIEIFKTVREVVKIPLMMKLRIGIDETEAAREDFWYICEHAIAGGVDALIVHGRTTSQYFRGKADWSVIAELKKKYPQTTIIGSGDLFEAEDIIAKMKTAAIDGIAIARGAIGKPWIFKQIIELLDGQTEIYQPDTQEQGRIILDHLDMLAELYEPKKRVWYFRKFLAHYSKHHAGEKRKLKMELVTAHDEEQLRTVIKTHYGV
ncbi:MAG: tRNA-dihydrouridine synthase family protein [Phycisphaerales bacterium]